MARLMRVERQVRGIRRLVQESRSCSEILQQVAAAGASLGRISMAILGYHASACVPAGVRQGPAEQARRLAGLGDMVDRFGR